MNITRTVAELTEYAVRRELITSDDRIYTINRLCSLLKLGAYPAPGDNDKDALPSQTPPELEEILDSMCDFAFEHGIITDNGITARDLFSTEVMGLVTPFPSTVIARFRQKYKKSPEAATDYFYKLAKDSDYIRTYRVQKDVKWIYADSQFGNIEITINLSKPEKDPKAIEAAKNAVKSGYPKCLLCVENEGFAGSMTQPARQNIRLLPLVLDGEDWRMQYSPYVYYNEHCIVLNSAHTPMSITASTFRKLLSFVEQFPHYFIGSNADLPIVGGSILSHDHMQGGCHSFAMAEAPVEIPVEFKDYPSVSAGIVNWPMSVIRLTGADREKLAGLADKILTAWRNYSDSDFRVLACGKLTPDTPDDIEKADAPHNTITPIARMKNGRYELDLVLRNNIRTAEHPLGLYHPHAEVHNIKKENIGLIEVMGLAVLPSRLVSEMDALKKAVLSGASLDSDPVLEKHKLWFDSFKDIYSFNEDNITDILRNEIGKTFKTVLEHAGVYKCTAEGRRGFLRFIDYINKD